MNGIFPKSENLITKTSAKEIGRCPAFVFTSNSAGEFLQSDGAIKENSGKNAIKQWFELMLRQQIGVVPIYCPNTTIQPGIDHELLNKNFPRGFIYSEIERNIRETADFNPAVADCIDFKFETIKRVLHIEFTAVLYNGERVKVEYEFN